jgi:hypothetical protein
MYSNAFIVERGFIHTSPNEKIETEERKNNTPRSAFTYVLNLQDINIVLHRCAYFLFSTYFDKATYIRDVR